MSHQDWIGLFAPAVAALVLAVAGIIAAALSGITTRLSGYLAANHQAAVASAIASANAVIQPALTTSANVIAGKIARGELDYTDRSAIASEATREVALVEKRVPAMIAVATPQLDDLVANVMGKVDAQLVSSITPLAAQVALAAVAATTTPLIIGAKP